MVMLDCFFKIWILHHFKIFHYVLDLQMLSGIHNFSSIKSKYRFCVRSLGSFWLKNNNNLPGILFQEVTGINFQVLY